MIALCQDCLRVVDIPEPVYSDGYDDFRCVCGGEVCADKCCLHTIELLRSGERDFIELGLISPIGEWSESEGVGKAG